MSKPNDERREKEREKERQEEEKRRELRRAEHLVFNRYWTDKKATVNDALEEVSYDMHCLLQILEGMVVTIYEHGVEPSGSCVEPSSSCDMQQEAVVFSGIHETLKILIPHMRHRLERAEDCYTDQLPARKKESQP